MAYIYIFIHELWQELWSNQSPVVLFPQWGRLFGFSNWCRAMRMKCFSHGNSSNTWHNNWDFSCMYVFIYIYMYTHIYVYIHREIDRHTDRHKCVHKCIYILVIHACIHTSFLIVYVPFQYIIIIVNYSQGQSQHTAYSLIHNQDESRI